MQNKPWKLSPTLLTNTVADIVNPPALSGGVGVVESATYVLLTHIRVANIDTVARTFTAYIGDTGESDPSNVFMGKDVAIPAGSYFDWYGRLPLSVIDFLTMSASADNALVVSMEGEIGVEN
jgi:hypothetical protein